MIIQTDGLLYHAKLSCQLNHF